MNYSKIHPNREKNPDNMVDGYSLEMTAKEIEGLRKAAPLIRPGAQVAVTFPPGVREVGANRLYLAYLRDPTGHKLCALHWM